MRRSFSILRAALKREVGGAQILEPSDDRKLRAAFGCYGGTAAARADAIPIVRRLQSTDRGFWVLCDCRPAAPKPPALVPVSETHLRRHVTDNWPQHAQCGREAGMATFAVRDQGRPDRWLLMPELIALYHRLADAGVLIGHPVAVGCRAALRLAIGAEDVLRGDILGSLEHLEEALKSLGFVPKPGLPPADAAGRDRRDAGSQPHSWN